MRRRKVKQSEKKAEAYNHNNAKTLLRPDVGLQAQFKQRRPPKTYRFDPSLDPSLSWDEGNPEREQAEVLIQKIRTAKTLDDAKANAETLGRMTRPFLKWAGKAERVEFTAPTLPLFVHERLSTKAILETLSRRKRDKTTQMTLFGDTNIDLTDRVLKAYEHTAPWTNRMILGDSLIVMNSLLQYEGLGGQVQMIYIDPPYGVKFGSNFQPFVRNKPDGSSAREVKHNDDFDMTREPEMVKAYRDTWELGVHSYLTYMRDRLLLSHELLTETGSIFVQISDENLHHVHELMDEVFGVDNFCGIIMFRKTGTHSAELIGSTFDFILWYAKDRERVKYRQLFLDETAPPPDDPNYVWLEFPDGTSRRMTGDERRREVALPKDGKVFRLGPITSPGASSTPQPFNYKGRTLSPGIGRHWSTSVEGLEEIVKAGRIIETGESIAFKLYWSDVPSRLPNVWDDTQSGGFMEEKLYVVQTTPKVIQRCILMTTDPGDLVLDPTCGGGTTAYMAEYWGRRWITIDTSRVPLALARQRLLTATYYWFDLADETKGPAGGFVYKTQQNSKNPKSLGVGIVPHVTIKNIAEHEPPIEEVLVDHPEVLEGITRVSGPFVVEATIPTSSDLPPHENIQTAIPQQRQEEGGDYIVRMVEVLRRSPVIWLPGNKKVIFQKIRRPARSMDIHAEATVSNGDEKSVAFFFGPEDGAVNEAMILRAAKEANAKNYSHLYIVGYAIQAGASKAMQNSEMILGIPATFVSATMDLQMADLLKTTRASQVFSVTGAPDIRLIRLKNSKGKEPLYKVEMLGLDIFDPVTMEVSHEKGKDIPVWFVDTDYNERVFCVSQAFFPRTSAWDNLKRDLKGIYDDGIWDHLAGTTSEPFNAGEEKRVAVKVIDDRGNELLVVKSIDEADAE